MELEKSVTKTPVLLSKKIKSINNQDASNYLREKIKNGTKIISLSGENLTLYGINIYKKLYSINLFMNEQKKQI